MMFYYNISSNSKDLIKVDLLAVNFVNGGTYFGKQVFEGTHDVSGKTESS
jgi:hypothetical protein